MKRKATTLTRKITRRDDNLLSSNIKITMLRRNARTYSKVLDNLYFLSLTFRRRIMSEKRSVKMGIKTTDGTTYATNLRKLRSRKIITKRSLRTLVRVLNRTSVDLRIIPVTTKVLNARSSVGILYRLNGNFKRRLITNAYKSIMRRSKGVRVLYRFRMIIMRLFLEDRNRTKNSSKRSINARINDALTRLGNLTNNSTTNAYMGKGATLSLVRANLSSNRLFIGKRYMNLTINTGKRSTISTTLSRALSLLTRSFRIRNLVKIRKNRSKNSSTFREGILRGHFLLFRMGLYFSIRTIRVASEWVLHTSSTIAKHVLFADEHYYYVPTSAEPSESSNFAPGPL